MAYALKALVVGIDNYPSSRLQGCVNDATEMADILAINGNGSPNFSVRLETNVSTKSRLRTMVVELFHGDPDIALFYFSGHGFLNELGGYIVTPDQNTYDEGISMYDILLLANKSKAKDKIIILDCCHSGAMGSPEVAQTCQLQEGVSILTASRHDEPSMEINGHGVFTNLLLDALRGGAADLRGHVSPGGIYAYIDQALGPWMQRPVFKTNVTRFTSLRTVMPPVSLDILRKLTVYFPRPQSAYDLNPSYEPTNSEMVKHAIVEPYTIEDNAAVFKHLQQLQSVGLVVPVDASHMYFAAMEFKSCKLTPLGHHYWRLVRDHQL